jgi:hypothetical protein
MPMQSSVRRNLNPEHGQLWQPGRIALVVSAIPRLCRLQNLLHLNLRLARRQQRWDQPEGKNQKESQVRGKETARLRDRPPFASVGVFAVSIDFMVTVRVTMLASLMSRARHSSSWMKPSAALETGSGAVRTMITATGSKRPGPTPLCFLVPCDG